MRQKGYSPIKSGFALIFLLIVFGLTVLAVYFAFKTYKSQNIISKISPELTDKPQVTIFPSNLPTSSGQDYKTYTNIGDKLFLKYPTDFIYDVKSSEFIPPFTLNTLIAVFGKVGFKNDTAQYSQTANFAISKSSDVQNCYSVDSKPATDVVKINGIEFKTVKSGGGAAGHEIASTVYRTVKNNTCFEIQTSIQSGTGSGEGLTKLQSAIETDKQNLEKEMDVILSSFKFTD